MTPTPPDAQAPGSERDELRGRALYDAVWEELAKWRPGMTDEVKNTLAKRMMERFAKKTDGLAFPPRSEPSEAGEAELRNIFAQELEKFGELTLAGQVRDGSDNSFGGRAAITALKRVTAPSSTEPSQAAGPYWTGWNDACDAILSLSFWKRAIAELKRPMPPPARSSPDAGLIELCALIKRLDGDTENRPWPEDAIKRALARRDGLLDSTYIAGAKAGYNLGLNEDHEGLTAIVEARAARLSSLSAKGEVGR